MQTKETFPEETAKETIPKGHLSIFSWALLTLFINSDTDIQHVVLCLHEPSADMSAKNVGVLVSRKKCLTHKRVMLCDIFH